MTKQKVPPVAIAIAAVVVLAFVLWRAWAAFGPVKAGPLPPPPTQDIAYIQQKAREAQGDWKRLSPADQARLQKVTHGWGQSAIASAWRKQQGSQ